MTPCFITIEGGEGSGKSTQIKLLSTRLTAKGIGHITTREPGGSPGADIIRSLLVTGDVARWDGMTEALLHFAARRDHVEKIIKPALAASLWVLCDRFFDSTIAYQGYGHGLSLQALEELRKISIDDFYPDLTFVIDLPVEVGLARAKQRADAEDRYEKMKIEFHHRMRQGFLNIVEAEPARCVMINGDDSIDRVADAIWNVVSERQLTGYGR